MEDQRLEFEDRLLACNSEMDRIAYQCNLAFVCSIIAYFMC